MSHPRMTLRDRLTARWKPVETKAQRLERVARQMRERNRLNLEKARKRREEWAKVRETSNIRWCLRCGHSWIAVIATRTQKCKRCQSPVWDQSVVPRIYAMAVDLPVARLEAFENTLTRPPSPTSTGSGLCG